VPLGQPKWACSPLGWLIDFRKMRNKQPPDLRVILREAFFNIQIHSVEENKLRLFFMQIKQPGCVRQTESAVLDPFCDSHPIRILKRQRETGVFDCFQEKRETIEYHPKRLSYSRGSSL
jgi:hypothetical protein